MTDGTKAALAKIVARAAVYGALGVGGLLGLMATSFFLGLACACFRVGWRIFG